MLDIACRTKRADRMAPYGGGLPIFSTFHPKEPRVPLTQLGGVLIVGEPDALTGGPTS